MLVTLLGHCFRVLLEGISSGSHLSIATKLPHGMFCALYPLFSLSKTNVLTLWLETLYCGEQPGLEGHHSQSRLGTIT